MAESVILGKKIANSTNFTTFRPHLASPQRHVTVTPVHLLVFYLMQISSISLLKQFSGLLMTNANIKRSTDLIIRFKCIEIMIGCMNNSIELVKTF